MGGLQLAIILGRQQALVEEDDEDLQVRPSPELRISTLRPYRTPRAGMLMRGFAGAAGADLQHEVERAVPWPRPRCPPPRVPTLLAYRKPQEPSRTLKQRVSRGLLSHDNLRQDPAGGAHSRLPLPLRPQLLRRVDEENLALAGRTLYVVLSTPQPTPCRQTKGSISNTQAAPPMQAPAGSSMQAPTHFRGPLSALNSPQQRAAPMSLSDDTEMLLPCAPRADLEVLEAKTPDQIYKDQFSEGRSGSMDSARANLASTFVNAFVNAGYAKDKLMKIGEQESEGAEVQDNKWLFKNKDHGMMSAAASVSAPKTPLLIRLSTHRFKRGVLLGEWPW